MDDKKMDKTKKKPHFHSLGTNGPCQNAWTLMQDFLKSGPYVIIPYNIVDFVDFVMCIF